MVNELAARYIAALDAKDRDALRALGSGDVTFVTPGHDAQGPRDLAAYLEKWTTGFPDERLEAGRIIGEGEFVACSWVFRGTDTGPCRPTPATCRRRASRSSDRPRHGRARRRPAEDPYMVQDQLLMVQQLGLP